METILFYLDFLCKLYYMVTTSVSFSSLWTDKSPIQKAPIEGMPRFVVGIMCSYINMGYTKLEL